MDLFIIITPEGQLIHDCIRETEDKAIIAFFNWNMGYRLNHENVSLLGRRSFWEAYEKIGFRCENISCDVLKEHGDKQTLQEAVNILMEAKSQLEYLGEKFKQTGTGNALISRIESFISSLNLDQ